MWHSLGKVTVAASGTPVRITTNQSDATARIGCQTVFIQQVPGNSGALYICENSSANITTGVGVLAVIPKPTLDGSGDAVSIPCGAVTIPYAAAPLNAADFYIDADNNGDAAYCSYVV